LVAEQIEMAVRCEHPLDLSQKLREALVREDLEPVVARRLAVLEPSRGADGAVLLQRFVRRIGDEQIHRRARQSAQEVDRVELIEAERAGLIHDFRSMTERGFLLKRSVSPGRTLFDGVRQKLLMIPGVTAEASHPSCRID
jgi:hypothetical protein